MGYLHARPDRKVESKERQARTRGYTAKYISVAVFLVMVNLEERKKKDLKVYTDLFHRPKVVQDLPNSQARGIGLFTS